MPPDIGPSYPRSFSRTLRLASTAATSAAPYAGVLEKGPRLFMGSARSRPPYFLEDVFWEVSPFVALQGDAPCTIDSVGCTCVTL